MSGYPCSMVALVFGWFSREFDLNLQLVEHIFVILLAFVGFHFFVAVICCRFHRSCMCVSMHNLFC